MNYKERLFIGCILLFTIAIGTADIITDSKEATIGWHIVIEFGLTLIAIAGLSILMKGLFKLKKNLNDEKEFSSKLLKESSAWKQRSKNFICGLSESISVQLDQWNLTKSEQEVAFLLIKGFSLKEIAKYRSTAEKTTRAQATSIYAKSGLSGRSQLSAFFLEDLLLPQKNNK